MAKKKEQYSCSNHLHLITRKLLISIEDRIERLNVVKQDNEIDQLKKTHELLFGNKTSIAGNLVILAELLEKLGGEADEYDGVIDQASSHRLSDADIALVESFISKMKNNAQNTEAERNAPET